MIKRVVCVNAEGRKYLTEGKVYDVVAIQDDGDYIIVDDRGEEIGTFADRFEDVTDEVSSKTYIKTVRCIDASDRKYLTEGNDYKVVGIQPDGDYIIVDDRGKEIKTLADRFVDITINDKILDYINHEDNSIQISVTITLNGKMDGINKVMRQMFH